MVKHSPGEKIQITTKEGEVFEGIFIPSTDKNTFIIKLDNGYNIGIDIKKIKSTKRISAGKKLNVFPSLNIKQSEGLPSVSVIATGGTISSRVDYSTGGVTRLMEPGQIFSLAPEISKIVKIRKIEKPFMIASENMDPDHWVKIAEETAKLLNSDDRGVLITHGTDTLHYTAAALSFMLKNLNKPVVLTYSQRSTDRGSTDTALNLKCSMHALLSDVAEVMLVGHAEASDSFCYGLRGTKARKMHTSMRNTFRPVNDKPLIKINGEGNISFISHNYNKRKDAEKVEVDTAFEKKIALVKYYPGADPCILDYYIGKKYRGIIIEATGLGHVATDNAKKSWLPAIKKAVKKGILICAVPQTLYGTLDPLVYDEGRKALEAGLLYLKDILPEVAYVKIGWVLGHTKNFEKAKEMTLMNYAHEFNDRITPDMFLF